MKYLEAYTYSFVRKTKDVIIFLLLYIRPSLSRGHDQLKEK